MHKIFFTILILFLVVSCNQPNGQIGGVITYKFKEETGDRPDVGAKILLIKEDELSKEEIKLFGLWDTIRPLVSIVTTLIGEIESDSLNILGYQERYAKYKIKPTDFDTVNIALDRQFIEKNKAILFEPLKKLQELRIDSIRQFAKVRKEVMTALDSVFTKSNTISLIADGSGKYSSSLPIGNYYVIVVCNHYEKNAAFKTGKLSFSKIEILAGNEVKLNYSFQPEFTYCYECLDNLDRW